MDRRQRRKYELQDALSRADLSGAVGPLVVMIEELTNTAVADVNAIKTSIASSASIATYTGAALNGVVGTGTMSPPRNITITTSSHADIDAVDVVITGTDVNGAAQTDTITLTDGGGVTDAGTEIFATVTQIVVPAQSGTGGALEFGFGTAVGFAKKAKDLAGEPLVILEISAGAVVTNGTFAAASAAGPNGSYIPNTAFDGARDTALIYVADEA